MFNFLQSIFTKATVFVASLLVSVGLISAPSPSMLSSNSSSSADVAEVKETISDQETISPEANVAPSPEKAKTIGVTTPQPQEQLQFQQQIQSDIQNLQVQVTQQQRALQQIQQGIAPPPPPPVQQVNPPPAVQKIQAKASIDVIPTNTTVVFDKSIEITKFVVAETSGLEDIKLQQLRIYNYGNAGDSNYRDVQLTTSDGTVLATVQPNGQYTTFIIPSYLIGKGSSRVFTIKATVVGGTGKAITLVLFNEYDALLKDETGLVVIPSAGTNDTQFPIGEINKILIPSGYLTIEKSDVPTKTVSLGSGNVVLAKFKINVFNEPIELRNFAFKIEKGGSSLFGEIYVKVNDSVVKKLPSNYTPTESPYGYGPTSFDSYLVINPNANNYLSFEVSMNAVVGNTYQVKGFNIYSAKRTITNDLISFSSYWGPNSDPSYSQLTPLDGDIITVTQ